MVRSNQPQKRRLNKFRVSVTVFALFLMAGIPAVYIHRHFNREPASQAKVRKVVPHAATASVVATKLSPIHITPNHKRPVFQYSVVPGGVHSAVEVAEAVKTDPVVRKHYSDVHVDSLHSYTLDKDTLAYVSYRMDGNVAWTHKQQHLRKGELLLADGKNMIRGRCGNRIAFAPVSTGAGFEPSEIVFDTVEPPPAVSPGTLMAFAAPASAVLPGLPLLAPPVPAAAISDFVPAAPIKRKKGLPFVVPAAFAGSAVAGGIAANKLNHPYTPPPVVTVAPEPVDFAWLLAIGFVCLLLSGRRRTAPQS
jgi:hypothetical protein